MSTLVGVFAKHWTPGRVKTRLAAAIGPERAASVARAFVETLLARLRPLSETRLLAFSPPEYEAAFAELAGPDWRVVPQCEGDLGQRMRFFFQAACEKQGTRSVLLGSDSPNVPVGYIQRALQALEASQLVLGPSADGGYYLIGARGGPPPVFDAMPWSSTNLWQATLDRLAEIGWREGGEFAVMPDWYDVDTADDLDHLRSDLRTTNEQALSHLAGRIDQIMAE